MRKHRRVVKAENSEDWEGKSQFAESDIGGAYETSRDQTSNGRGDFVDWGTEILG